MQSDSESEKSSQKLKDMGQGGAIPNALIILLGGRIIEVKWNVTPPDCGYCRRFTGSSLDENAENPYRCPACGREVTFRIVNRESGKDASGNESKI